MLGFLKEIVEQCLTRLSVGQSTSGWKIAEAVSKRRDGDKKERNLLGAGTKKWVLRLLDEGGRRRRKRRRIWRWEALAVAMRMKSEGVVKYVCGCK